LQKATKKKRRRKMMMKLINLNQLLQAHRALLLSVVV
jgi:hypothetical protein